MAASHVLSRLLQIYLICLNIFYVISLKKCADLHCKVPISIAVAEEDHQSSNENYISFKKGEELTIFSKNVRPDNSIWEGSVGGAPAGFLRSTLVTETAIIVSDDALVDVAPKHEQGNLKTSENVESSEESEQHDDEMEEEVTEIEDEQTDDLEDPDDGNDAPVEAPTIQDQNQAENNHPSNEDKDDGKQDKIMNDYERTVRHSESESSSKDAMEDDGQNQKNENDNPQFAMADNERSKKTEVYTDPSGVQYDVEVVPGTPQVSNDEFEVIKVTEEKLPDANEDDPEEVTGHKVNDDVEQESAADGDKESPGKKKAGFFSSIGNIVSDFTENIMKDFQGEEDKNDEVTKDNQDEPTEDPAVKKENIDEKAEEKENVEADSREKESNRKPSEFKGLQEKFQQMKAARLERMKESIARSEAKFPPVDEEEILKQEAKRTVEGIPGLMSDRVESDEVSETKVSGDGQKNEEPVPTTQESGVETENQTPPKQYSDEVLCSSVAVEYREVCLASGSEEECLLDNCCYDKTAEPGRQCFYKPSSLESGLAEEDLISKEEERLQKDNAAATAAAAALETDENNSESREPAKSTIFEKPNATEVVSDETKETSDIDSSRQSDIDDQGQDEVEVTTETKNIESVEKTDDEVDSRHVGENALADADVDEPTNKATQEASPEEDTTAETVNDTASRKQAEQTLPEARNVGDDKQQDVEENARDDEESTEEKTKSVSETEEDENYVKASKESVDNDDSSEDNIDAQKSSDESKGANLSDETTNVESKEKQNDDLKFDDEPLAASIENEDSSKEHTTEEEDVESRVGDAESGVRDARSDHEDDTSTEEEDVESRVRDARSDHEDDTSQDTSAKKDDMDGQGISSSAGLKDQKHDKKDATGQDDESVERKDDHEDFLQKKNFKVESEGDAAGEKDEMKSGDPRSDSSSPEEASVSDESKEDTSRQESSETHSAGNNEREEEIGNKDREEGIRTPREKETESKERDEETGSKEREEEIGTPASLVEEMSEENQEVLLDENVGEKKEAIYVEGLLDKLKMLLPDGENTTAKDRSSEDVKVSKDESVEKIRREDEDKASSKGGEENQDQTVDVEGIMDGIKKVLPGGGPEEKDSNDEDSDKSEKQKTEKILADILEEESSNTNVTTDTIIPETKDARDVEERNVESGSTHFLNDTEPTLPVEKTLDGKPELNDSSSQETKTGIEGTKTGVEEARTEIKPDIVPTQTSTVESSQTITAGHRPFEKKLPDIASKWMKNKLMKGKRMEGEAPVPSDVKMDEDLHSGTKDSGTGDPQSGTCAKDGTCEGTVTLSSSITRSLLDDDDISNLDDDDIVVPRPEIEGEEPEVKSVKTQFLETLVVAVRKFREYHNVVADYGLQVLKPVKNVTKLLGEQMGLGKTIDYMEREMKQGPQGVIAVTLIMIAFAAYFMLSTVCGKKVPPCYGPSLKDIFKTYEGRIRILEEECTDYEERINNLRNKAEEDVENSSALEKQLDDEKHERNKSDEQISILKKIVENLKEKVALLEEESSKLKQSLVEKTGRIANMEEQLSEKSKEIETIEEKNEKLEELLKEKDEEKSVLNENIDEYKKHLSKAEDDTDRHKTMLQDWNDRYHELEQKYDDMSVSNQTLEEQIRFKDNEIEVLRDSLVQINGDVHINSDEELSQEEMQEARSTKIKELMDVSQIRTDYKLCKEEKEKLEEDIKQEMNKREKLEGEVEQLEIDLAKSKASEEEIRFKYREADIKLNALQDYFKNMENDLHRKLTAEEAARMASESELERKLREASTAVQDVELYRKQVEELRKEIHETQQAFRAQTSSTEERAHENWLKFRSAERELEEIKRERDALRRRLYDVETSSKVVAPVDDLAPITSTTAENLQSPADRSESPATSVRSSKRKNSNPRGSPSGSPLDERKERVRRKPRERNSPPSWEPDMGPRKRDKDRVTPPPPPPLWDPNMGLPQRRKGHSPIVPTTMDADIQRRRRDRYTPSPPPPPDTRRRRRDRPAPSSSPPPPPPAPGMFPPRGAGLPMERPPPPTNTPQFSMRGGPPRMNAPLARKPPPSDIMAPQPTGGRINGAPFQEQSPSQTYVRRGGDSERGVNTEIQRPPPMTRTAGPPPNISPLRGTLPQGGTPNEQISPYNNSTISNNSRGGEGPSDRPPPPPVFANNGPYPRTPSKKIPTLPS